MLSKNNRFNIRKDFLTLKKTGKMINSVSFGFLYIKNGIGQRQSSVPTTKNVGDDFYVVPNSHFNFIVSTKISKKATERNLIRRRLAEITRELLLTKNISGVFLVKKSILFKTYKELHDEVVKMVEKIS
jgi:ribonuclease P protein component